MPKFQAPQTHNVVWLHTSGVTAYDRETGYERTFYRYAFKLPKEDAKIVHIGAVQTADRVTADIEIRNRMVHAGAVLWDGTMVFDDLAPALKAMRHG